MGVKPSCASAGCPQECSSLTDSHSSWLALDVQPGDPITGRVRHLDGSVREFSGWLGLALELERALVSAQPDNSDEGTTPCSSSSEPLDQAAR